MKTRKHTKPIALALACVMVFALSASIFAVTAKTFLRGDVSGNGKIDSADYAMVKRSVLNTYELNEVQKLIADVNGNGKVDAADYAMIKRHVLGTYKINGD